MSEKEKAGRWGLSETERYLILMNLFAVAAILLWFFAAFFRSAWLFLMGLLLLTISLIFIRVIREELEGHCARRIVKMEKSGKFPRRLAASRWFMKKYGIRRGNAIFLTIIYLPSLPVLWIVTKVYGYGGYFSVYAIGGALAMIWTYRFNVCVYERAKRLE